MRPVGLNKTDRFARELVALTGESITAAVTVALREQLKRFRAIDDSADRTSIDQGLTPNPSRDRDRAER